MDEFELNAELSARVTERTDKDPEILRLRREVRQAWEALNTLETELHAREDAIIEAAKDELGIIGQSAYEDDLELIRRGR